jgi:cobalt-zinc-cadmium efflux system protein
MSRHHDHSAVSAGARHRGRLLAAFCIVGLFFVVELVAALLTGSLALLADAGHMLTDVLGLALALAAIQAATSRLAHSPQRSFGVYRLEILAALVNAGLLVALAGYVLYEAGRRLLEPPEVFAGPMLAVAVVGLAANLVAFWLLRPGARESLNLRGAYLEVAADTLSSVGVIVAAVVLVTTGWPYVDPMIALGIALWVLPRAWMLGREALRILLQAAPADVPLDELHHELAAIDGVVDVHDVHVWTLTSGMEVATAHLMIHAGEDAHGVLDRARQVLIERYGVEHATLQVEPDDHSGCAEVRW